jgi:hypothetical protein
VNALDGVLKLAVTCYDARAEPKKVSNLEEITTATVDRARATIAAGM